METFKELGGAVLSQAYRSFFLLILAVIFVGCQGPNGRTTAVAYETIEGPRVAQETAPGHCYNWIWRVRFFPTTGSGLSPGVSTTTGFIVQHVRTTKTIFLCDATRDPNSPAPVDEWEYFELDADGRATDVNVEVFLGNRRTTVQTTLEAGYLPQIEGANRTPTPNNPLGSSGTLSSQPTGFQPTLIREYSFEMNCCGESFGQFTFDWTGTARNTFGTYSERWRKAGQGTVQETDEHEKVVDGQRVE